MQKPLITYKNNGAHKTNVYWDINLFPRNVLLTGRFMDWSSIYCHANGNTCSTQGTLRMFGDDIGPFVARSIEVPLVLGWLQPYLGK